MGIMDLLYARYQRRNFDRKKFMLRFEFPLNLKGEYLVGFKRKGADYRSAPCKVLCLF